MNYSKVRIQGLLRDLQSISAGDSLNKSQVLSILNSTIPGAVSSAGESSVRVLMETYGLTFSDSEWLQIARRFSTSGGQPLDPNWGNHNASSQQFARPVSSDGFYSNR